MDIVKRGLEGDIVETGVWRGGVSMVMRQVTLITETDTRHHSWLFDSYEGLPNETDLDIAQRVAFVEDVHAKMDPAGSYSFQGGVETVKKDFDKMLGGRNNKSTIHFVKGWFKDTVYDAAVNKISVYTIGRRYVQLDYGRSSCFLNRTCYY